VLVLCSPLLSRLGLRGRWAAGLALIAFFGMLTRWEPSVLRASAMAVLVGCWPAWPGGRPPCPWGASSGATSLPSASWRPAPCWPPPVPARRPSRRRPGRHLGGAGAGVATRGRAAPVMPAPGSELWRSGAVVLAADFSTGMAVTFASSLITAPWAAGS
jgi:hypothetical protein